MVDILKVTTPLPGHDNTGKTKPFTQNETSVQHIPDPSKVTKTNPQNVFSDKQSGQFSPNLQSNFEKFMQLVRNTPSTTESYSKIFFSRFGSIVSSGMGEGIADEMSAYMDMLKMTEAELLNLLKNGQTASMKFNGVFFDMLRYVLNSNSSTDLKDAVLDFLKKFDSLTGGNHILNNMVHNLKNISVRLPSSVSTELNQMISQLELGHANGDHDKNLSILKNEIIPYLSNYISRTKDFGSVRDLINMLVLNLARYEMGTKENFTQSFRTLIGYSQIQSQLEGVPVSELEQFLLSHKSQETNHAMVDKLIQIISRGVNGEAGYENKQIFQNILHSALVNESVYMPLVHMMFPAEINGNQLFSELWVDPNSQQGNENDKNPSIKMLIKFDIKNLGYFEIVLLAQGNKVEMELFYPERLEPMKKVMREEISSILDKNGLSFQALLMEKCVAPKTISEVFPKIYEGRNIVNVTI